MKGVYEKKIFKRRTLDGDTVWTSIQFGLVGHGEIYTTSSLPLAEELDWSSSVGWLPTFDLLRLELDLA